MFILKYPIFLFGGIMKNRIPMIDLKDEVDFLWDELNVAIGSVLKSGIFIMGPEVAGFEKNIAEYLGVKHAIAVNSGTDALVISLRAMGIKDGDEVITTPFSFFATAESISNVGANPIFVDIEPIGYGINSKIVEKFITSKTKAIIPVHLYGKPVDMDEIMYISKKYNLKVLEDCAQSFGAYFNKCRVGTIGNMGAFSFFPSKNLGAYGDAGMIVTNDDHLAVQARMLRSHGSLKKYYNELVGYNSRMDEIQAAILNVKLQYIDEWNKKRRELALRYNFLLSSIPGIVVPQYTENHVFHQYTIRVLKQKRDGLQRYLRSFGIDSMVYYPIPQDKLPVYNDKYDLFFESDIAAAEVLSLPMWPYMSLLDQDEVVEKIKEFFDDRR